MLGGARRWSVLVATVVCGLSMLGLGCWALLVPDAFAEFIAYPPFNEHLIHDAGAFQIGIGTAVLAAVLWSDALTVALAGFIAANGLHTVSHVVDRHLGGHDADAPTLGLLTALGVFAIYARLRCRRA